MNGYTPKQQEYINSVDGNAHMSAVEIIGELEERHNALVEAVKKLITADEKWCAAYGEDEETQITAIDELNAARAEVDRLIANESAADCEGEG